MEARSRHVIVLSGIIYGLCKSVCKGAVRTAAGVSLFDQGAHPPAHPQASVGAHHTDANHQDAVVTATNVSSLAWDAHLPALHPASNGANHKDAHLREDAPRPSVADVFPFGCGAHPPAHRLATAGSHHRHTYHKETVLLTTQASMSSAYPWWYPRRFIVSSRYTCRATRPASRVQKKPCIENCRPCSAEYSLYNFYGDPLKGHLHAGIYY